MLVGTTELYIKKSLSDEWALYRVNENKQSFLLFSFDDDQDEALIKGEQIAKILGVRFRNKVPPGLISEIETGVKITKKVGTKPGRVKGIGKLCHQLLEEGKSDQEIKDILTQKYIEAGRDQKEAKWYASGILSDAKKVKS